MLESVAAEKRLGFIDQQLGQKQQIKLKTCADVYEQWRSCKRHYRKAPADGLEFQVDYIDTGALLIDNNERSKAPVALALHGAPGSYHDFALLIQHLSQQGVRVIAPNFPEYTATVKTKVLFRHSADEKAAYLRDFLKAINVNKIDLLVSHSSAIFPTLLILLNASNKCLEANNKKNKQEDADIRAGDKSKSASVEQLPVVSVGEEATDSNNNNTEKGYTENELPETKSARRVRRKGRSEQVIAKFEQPIEIKAVALFNPAGHRLPKSMKPAWFKCGSVHVYQHKLGRSLFRKLGPAFLTVVGVPVRVDNMDNVMLSATVMRNSKCHRLVHQLQQLARLKVPTLLVFSENDKLIEREIFYEMTQFMQLDPNNFDVFDDTGDIELSQSKQNDWIRVMVFKAGGHYAYSNYARTVNKAVSELMQKVASKEEPARDTC